jgi:hypothetical protein
LPFNSPNLSKQPAEFLLYGADFLNRDQREHRRSFHAVLWRSQVLHDFSDVFMEFLTALLNVALVSSDATPGLPLT